MKLKFPNGLGHNFSYTVHLIPVPDGYFCRYRSGYKILVPVKCEFLTDEIPFMKNQQTIFKSQETSWLTELLSLYVIHRAK